MALRSEVANPHFAMTTNVRRGVGRNVSVAVAGVRPLPHRQVSNVHNVTRRHGPQLRVLRHVSTHRQGHADNGQYGMARAQQRVLHSFHLRLHRVRVLRLTGARQEIVPRRQYPIVGRQRGHAQSIQNGLLPNTITKVILALCTGRRAQLHVLPNVGTGSHRLPRLQVYTIDAGRRLHTGRFATLRFRLLGVVVSVWYGRQT